jgi:hypothetical protein
MSKRRRPASRNTPQPGFWGWPDRTPDPPVAIRATPDPSAVPRSLGDPPLGPNAAATQRHLGLVYEEAVRAATALAAANNLLLMERNAGD